MLKKLALALLIALSTNADARIHGGAANGTVPSFGPGSPGFLSTCSAKFAGAPTTPVNCPAGVAFRDFSPLTYNAVVIPGNTVSYNAGGVNGMFTSTTVASGTLYSLANCTVAGPGGTRDLWQHQCLYSGTDIAHWTLLSDAFTNGAGQWDDNYMLHNAIAPKNSCSLANWCAYYSARNSAQSVWKIGIATSSNLISWSKYGSNPLSLTGGGITNPGLPTIVQIGSTLYMYVANNGNSSTAIEYLTSPVGDGVTWTYGGVALPPPISADWAFTCPAGQSLFGLLDPYVFKNSHGFYEMAYTQFCEGSGFTQKVGYAVSADGQTWWPYQAAPIITNGSTAYPGTFYIGDTNFSEDGTNFNVLLGIDDASNNASSILTQMADH